MKEIATKCLVLKETRDDSGYSPSSRSRPQAIFRSNSQVKKT